MKGKKTAPIDESKLKCPADWEKLTSVQLATVGLKLRASVIHNRIKLQGMSKCEAATTPLARKGGYLRATEPTPAFATSLAADWLKKPMKGKVQ